MSNFRIFAALPLPDAIAGQVMPLMKGVPGAAWRPRENLHITLAFYGSVQEASVTELDHALDRIRVSPFELQLEEADHFGKDDLRSLWLKVSEPPELTELAQACRKAGQSVGITIERRVFKPHLTLAYIRGQTDPRRLASFEQKLALYRSEPFIADRFHLYSSWAQDRGPNRYDVETEYPLLY